MYLLLETTMEVEVIYRTGNIANDESDMIINTVNCVGVMGKGVALAYKKKFPAMFKEYKQLCIEKKIRIGKMFVFITKNEDRTQYVVNFPTKYYWRKPSKLEWIEYGLEDLSNLMLTCNPATLAIPPLGCGNGGLKWERVEPMVMQYLVNSRKLLKGEKLTIYIYNAKVNGK